MLVLLAFTFIIMKVLGIVNLSWWLVVLAELLVLVLSVIELKYIYKKINKRFK